MFCMLLRKHLVGARIDALTQPENERMVILELTARDELGVETRKRLAVELMGRSSNVVLVDGEGVIIDCLRRADFGEGAYRRLLPGMLYRLPPKPAKPNLLELSGEQLRAAIGAAATDKPGDKRLMDAFSGLSPLIARELASRAERGGDLAAAVEAYAESVRAREFTPVMVFEDGQPRDFSFMRITQYGAAAACEPRGSFSDLLEEFYAGRERAERMRRMPESKRTAALLAFMALEGLFYTTKFGLNPLDGEEKRRIFGEIGAAFPGIRRDKGEEKGAS